MAPKFLRPGSGISQRASIYGSEHRSHEAPMSDSTLSLIARTGLDQSRAETLLKRGLEGADDG